MRQLTYLFGDYMITREFSQSICFPDGTIRIAHTPEEAELLIFNANAMHGRVDTAVVEEGDMIYVYIDPLKYRPDLRSKTIVFNVCGKVEAISCSKKYYEENFTKENGDALEDTGDGSSEQADGKVDGEEQKQSDGEETPKGSVC
jgi:hypothetical protein